jgi:hypothetical protein
LVFGTLVAVMVLGVAWPWISMHGLSATLVFRPRALPRDGVGFGALTVRNRWPWPAWGLVVERGFFEPAGEDDPTTGSDRVGPRSRLVAERLCILVPPRAARRVSARSPGACHGLSVRHLEPHAADPGRGRTDRLAADGVLDFGACGGRRPADGGRQPVDSAGDDGDILASRFYREGDPLRRVHWAQTARRDVLVVCQRQTTARRRVVVALDGAAFAGSTRRDGSRRDWAVRVCASLCRELHAHHCDVECRLNGQSLLLEPGPAGSRRLLDRLARYEPSDDTKISGPAFRDQRDSPSTRDDGSLLIVVSRELRSVPRASRVRSAARPRWVLIDDRTPRDAGSTGNTGATAAKPWIVLDASADVAGQLQVQWGRLCHDDWRIN